MNLASAADNQDVFVFSDETKDSYQGQSTICISKDTTFYPKDGFYDELICENPKQYVVGKKLYYASEEVY